MTLEPPRCNTKPRLKDQEYRPRRPCLRASGVRLTRQHSCRFLGHSTVDLRPAPVLEVLRASIMASWTCWVSCTKPYFLGPGDERVLEGPDRAVMVAEGIERVLADTMVRIPQLDIISGARDETSSPHVRLIRRHQRHGPG